MPSLVSKAFLELIYCDFYLMRGDFQKLYERVRNRPMSDRGSSIDVIQSICAAVDIAGIWYWKEVRCLQRSAALTCLLKSYGVHAQMVLGAQKLPFKAHAWVEVDGRPINERVDVKTIYGIWDRC